MKKVKQQATKVASDVKYGINRLEKFVLTLALSALVGNGFYSYYNVPMRNEYRYSLIVSAVIVGLVALSKFWEFFFKQEK